MPQFAEAATARAVDQDRLARLGDFLLALGDPGIARGETFLFGEMFFSPDQDLVVAESEELSKRRGLLQEALLTLKERERHILTERRLKDDPTTLEDLSQVYNISRERVRQIEVRAFEKLQKAIRNAAIEQRLAANFS